MSFDFAGMHLPIGLFEDEVRQFATRKRMAFDASSSHALKKSRATDPSIVLNSSDVPSVAPFIIALHALMAATTFEAPPTIIRSEEDVVVIDVPAIAPVSEAQPAVAMPTP